MRGSLTPVYYRGETPERPPYDSGPYAQGSRGLALASEGSRGSALKEEMCSWLNAPGNKPTLENCIQTITCFHCWLQAGSQSSVPNSCPEPMALAKRYRGGGFHSPDSGSLPIIKTLGKFITISCWSTSYRNKKDKIPLRTGNKNKE